MHHPILYLMLGYPGAGKTTAAKFIAELTGATLLSSDELRTELFQQPTFSQAEHRSLYEELNKHTEELLRAGIGVIYDANLNRFEHREEKYDICVRTGAKPVLIWVQTPSAMAKARAVHDSRQHLVPPNETPEDMFDRIAKVIEPPKPSEHAITLDGSSLERETVKQALEHAGLLTS